MAAPYAEKGSCRQRVYKGLLSADDLCPPCRHDEDGPGDRQLRREFTRSQISGRCFKLHPDQVPTASVPERLAALDKPVAAVLDRATRATRLGSLLSSCKSLVKLSMISSSAS